MVLLIRKNGQSEMVGLVIIVLILIVVGLLFLRFSLESKDKYSDKSMLSVKANNLINAIRLASVCNRHMYDAIIACCNGLEFCSRDACQLASEEISKIINKSLEEYVYFEAENKGNLCFSINSECQGISSTSNFVRNNEGEAQINLKICR